MIGEESDREPIPVNLPGGGFIGMMYASGVYDHHEDEKLCLEHGKALAERVKDPARFTFIYDQTETDYEYSCEWLLTGVRCYGFVATNKRQHVCDYNKPNVLQKLLDLILRRKRTHNHPVFCGKNIDTSVIEEDE